MQVFLCKTSAISSGFSICTSLLPGTLVLLYSVYLFPVATLAQQGAAVDRGDLHLVFKPASNHSEQLIEDTIREHGEIGELINALNQHVLLEQDIYVVFAPWSEIETRSIDYEANAAYDSRTREILISYGLLIDITERFQRHGYIESSRDDFPYEFADKIYPTLVHTFYHELAHALIHVNGIFPQANTCEEKHEEELLADELSVLVGENDDIDFMPVLDNFLFMHQDQESGPNLNLPVAVFRGCESHPDDESRDQNLMCWIYGKSPGKYSDELENPENWQDCIREYEELEFEWEERLSPILLQ